MALFLLRRTALLCIGVQVKQLEAMMLDEILSHRFLAGANTWRLCQNLQLYLDVIELFWLTSANTDEHLVSEWRGSAVEAAVKKFNRGTCLGAIKGGSPR